ncbi:MAG: vanomycin resistance protein VanB [Chloroflexi bacterium AL-W]|nr:vanomycin resistance protein VanB [Chloroflexi bacterium AL-N1]NOK66204.1 vanomycin resistance protein VanB [Chloroflexi bacterium AL-N10]NOK73085.1 vanomycin resistance protein VanB [Chloroflexi bacterium AL-N5]NOK79982.1 vanomycin resistance protein VanB [Chloroflexi bacterium AL-W]NOK88162.1 vanomycin resistance protein VanB [Chloroflexi bacterium AL-N15]
MADKYYQKYGPIQRRRSNGVFEYEEAVVPRPEPTPETPPTRYRAQRQRRSMVKPVAFIVVAISIAVLLPFATNLFMGNQAMQGVSIQGQAVSGMSRDALQAELEAQYASFQTTPITLSFDDRTWTPSLDQLGAKLDIETMVDTAMMTGRHGGPIERIQDLWALWSGGVDIGPRLIVDQQVLQAYLSIAALEVEQPPRDAALSVAEGKVVPTGARDGRQVLVDETADDVILSLESLESQTVVMRTRLLDPTIDDTEVALVADEARELLDTPLTLQQADRSWTWEPERIASLLEVARDDSTMSISIDEQRLAAAVENLTQLVNSPTAEPRVAFNNGVLAISQPGQTGWRLEQPEAVEAIREAIYAGDRTLNLPVDELSPQVTAETLPELGIVEVVGEGKTSFAGSADYRITNIKAGAAQLNGVLIAPGEEFSFNTQIGSIDEENGFVQGYAVIGNRTQLEWGGGVCQDSTTVFRAAFWAGLPITERHAHPFYISWYDDYSFPEEASPGMDAAIYTGVQDLKFVNDTENWLLMEALVDEVNQVMTVQLYGTSPERTVTVSGPTIDNVVAPPATPVYLDDFTLSAGTVQQTDTARRGMDISVYRIISENGVQQEPELFFTRFKAWPDVFVRGTGQ